MPYAVTCKACGARFSVGDDLYKKRVAGKFVTINCRSCRAPIRLDGAETPTRRNSSRPPSATRSFPSRPPMPPGPTRMAPARLPSIQRTQLGGLTARAPAAPSAQPRPGGSPPATAQQAAARGAPSPPRPRALGNLPQVMPSASQNLADALGDQEEATTPFGGFYDVSEEVESIPPSAGSVDLTDDAEALPPSVPLATQLARSRVPHPPKKLDPSSKDSAVDGASLDDDPDFLLGLRRGATEAPPAAVAKAAAPATSSPATTTPTPPTPVKVAAAPAEETAKPAGTAKPAEAAKPAAATKPAKAVQPALQPSLSEMLQPPAVLSSPVAGRKKSSSLGAVLALFVLSLAAVGAYRYLNADESPAEEAETAVAPREQPVEAVTKAAPPPAERASAEVTPTVAPVPDPKAAEPSVAAEPPAAAVPPPAAAPAPKPQARADSAAPAAAAPKPASAPVAAKPAEPKPAEDKPASTKPSKPAGPVGPFDRAAAAASLSQAASQASSCKKPGDPSGTAGVTITFAPSGRVTSATLSGPPFAGTPTGSCIASALRRASVPPFEGERVTVSKTVVIN